MPKTVRAKFTCNAVRKSQGSAWNQETQKSEIMMLYEYEFWAVSSGSEENKSFFASTPSGSIKLGATRNDLFEVGKAYYLDFTEAVGA